MTDEIDTSNEAVGRLVFASVTASPSPMRAMSTTLCALAVERDALRQRAEEAQASDAESIAMYRRARDRAEKAEAALRLALPMMRKDDWGADYGDGTERRDALYATLAALRQDEGGE